MRKIISCALLLAMCLCICACNDANSDASTAGETYQVVFRQAGQEDIVFDVKKGDSVENPPECVPKKGYTIVWDTADYTNITSDLLVTATETANEYVITYLSGLTDEQKYGYAIEATAQAVVFDGDVILYVPTAGNLIFKGWKVWGTEEVFVGGKYTVADDLNLVAVWDIPNLEYSDRV